MRLYYRELNNTSFLTEQKLGVYAAFQKALILLSLVNEISTKIGKILISLYASFRHMSGPKYV